MKCSNRIVVLALAKQILRAAAESPVHNVTLYGVTVYAEHFKLFSIRSKTIYKNGLTRRRALDILAAAIESFTPATGKDK